jgi:RpiB/LacA/LacB family sugar-phosphate isomerase
MAATTGWLVGTASAILGPGMRIALGCDHAGFPYKAAMRQALEADGHAVLDLGTSSTDPVDYPDYARTVGVAVRDGAADAGILICGSGAGVSVAANKIRGVRAALCHDLFTARQSREDDDANVLCLGARVIARELAITLARQFLSASFSGAPRHVRRLQKVAELERTMADETVGAGRGGLPRAPRKSVLDLGPVSEALARLERSQAGRRIWAEDPSLWSDDDAIRASIKNRLGWLTVAGAMRSHLEELRAFSAEIRSDGFTHVVLLGMGGSSLAAETLARTFGQASDAPGGLSDAAGGASNTAGGASNSPGGASNAPVLTVLDTTDPGAIRGVVGQLKLSETLFLVSSKSGTTAEMLALYRFFRAELEAQVEHAGRHFVAITDPGTPLERLAADAGFRRTFLNDPRIGGRYSALSLFGLVPAALIGIDVAGLLERAEAMAARCGATVPVRDNPGLQLGAILGGLAHAGRDKLTLVLSGPIASLGAWLEQLITESTGKQSRGVVVVNEEPRVAASLYGNDRVFVSLALEGHPRAEDWLNAIEDAGHPLVRLTVADRLDLGVEFFRWELATAAVGTVLGLNPFDEPNVAQAKDATQAALATFKESGGLPEWPVDRVEDVARTLVQARPGDYVALLAYLTPAPETTASLQALRALVIERTRLATTLGYGPRYLHSTGQLHKGGPPTPILLLFTGDDPEDVAIPGESYGFSVLKSAQALGDLATLRAAQRRAFLLRVKGRPPEALRRLTATLAKLLTKA